MKESADNNFKLDENGRKLSKWVENTVGKGEIAPYEQFLRFPQCFQKTYKPGLIWERVNPLPYKEILKTYLEAFADGDLTLPQTIKFLFDGKKHWRKSKKMSVTSIFSFSHNIFKSFLFGLINLYHTTKFWTGPN